MVHIESTKAIVTTSVGRPDYSGETWQAKTLKHIEFHENEIGKSFQICASAVASPYVWVVPPIAVGVPTYLIDTDTGLPMPYAVLAGYELEVMMIWASFSQNIRMVQEYEGFLGAEFYSDALSVYYENEVFEFTTELLDPTFTFPHLVGFAGENVGIANMTGFAEVICALRLHHTEKPTVKQIRCKYCGNTISVSFATNKWNCTKCGKLNLYFTMSQYRAQKVVK